MVATVDDALWMVKVAGALAYWGGRPKDDCPYSPDKMTKAHTSWIKGWQQAKELENG